MNNCVIAQRYITSFLKFHIAKLHSASAGTEVTKSPI